VSLKGWILLPDDACVANDIANGKMLTPYHRSKSDPSLPEVHHPSNLDPSLGRPTSAEPGERNVIDVNEWAEIRRLHRGEGMGIKAIARHLGIARNTVKSALGSTEPPAYRRPSPGSVLDAVEADIRRLLAKTPDMPATVVAERIGWQTPRWCGGPGPRRQAQWGVATTDLQRSEHPNTRTPGPRGRQLHPRAGQHVAGLAQHRPETCAGTGGSLPARPGAGSNKVAYMLPR
jgi:hypothetical protein